MDNWWKTPLALVFWTLATLSMLLIADLEAMRVKFAVEQMQTMIVWEGESGPTFPFADGILMLVSFLVSVPCTYQMFRCLLSELVQRT
jgi:hypothetical protein